MNVRRRFAFAALVIGLLLAMLAVVGPAKAGGGGAVANACGIKAEVMVARKVRGGINPTWLKCGEGKGPVNWATVTDHPFYVKLPGTAPFCMQAGQKFYPNNRGLNDTAVIYPTIRCKTPVFRR